MRKAYRNKPLSDADQKFNKGVSRIRVRVEYVFGRMKQLGMDLVRSIGLKRASQHNSLSNMVYNMDRYAFLTGTSIPEHSSVALLGLCFFGVLLRRRRK